jgi:hypothetical protein
MGWNELEFKPLGDEITYEDINKIRENILYLYDSLAAYHTIADGTHTQKGCEVIMSQGIDNNGDQKIIKDTSFNVLKEGTSFIAFHPEIGEHLFLSGCVWRKNNNFTLSNVYIIEPTYSTVALGTMRSYLAFTNPYLAGSTSADENFNTSTIVV